MYHLQSKPSHQINHLLQLFKLAFYILPVPRKFPSWIIFLHQGENLEEELLLLEQQVRRNDAEMDEEEFWQNELQIEQESERQLRQQLVELQARVHDCEDKLSEYLASIQVSVASLSSLTVDQQPQMLEKEASFMHKVISALLMLSSSLF